MKNNKLLKISLIIITIISIVCIAGIVNADFQQPKNFTGASSELSGKVGGYANIILGIFQVVGYSTAVIILVWLGVKYIMASPDGKAEIKKQAFAYLLGALLLFAASTIVTAIKTVIDSESGANTNNSGYIQVIDERKC